MRGCVYTCEKYANCICGIDAVDISIYLSIFFSGGCTHTHTGLDSSVHLQQWLLKVGSREWSHLSHTALGRRV